MSSPIIWIFFPALVSMGLFLSRKNRTVTFIIGSAISFGFILLALWLPVDSIIKAGSLEFKISGSLSILGRQFILGQDRQAILILIYAITTFWLFGGWVTSAPAILAPVSLLLNAFLVGSLAVNPFLYGAIFIEIAVLITIPLLVQGSKRLSPGGLRFLTFQTIGMTFLLFTGWLLGGFETAPTDQAAITRALVFLGLGFAFILAIFPFYSWIPMLTEHEDPYVTGFILILFPTAILLFGIAFIEKYSWLRNSLELQRSLQIVGTLMVVTGGIWSAFQRNLGRMFGYAVIIENGLSLISIGLITQNGFLIFANQFLPRILAFGLWALCLSLIKQKYGSLELTNIMGIGKSSPLLIVGLLAAQFSIGGLPLLAGFPLRVAILEEIATQSAGITLAIIIGIGGIWAAGLYSLSIFLRSESKWNKLFESNLTVNALLILGIAGLLVMGFFPHSYSASMIKILLPYTHLY
jgi:formate hydrogenlyase subunit 3/multisubunit Na+/H+ antiporter MnhD subunit